MKSPIQHPLPGMNSFVPASTEFDIENNSNTIEESDRPIHEWFRFVLSFPPHLVRHYLKDFSLDKDSVVLDPFCGTGTTVVEAKSKGFRSIGVEAYPFSHFASTVKTDWSIDHHEMVSVAAEIAENVHSLLGASGIDDSFVYLGAIPIVGLPELEENRRKLLIKDSISPVPLQKSLTLLASIDTYSDRAFHAHMRLAFAKTLVSSISNLHFGPEVGVGKIKRDSPVIAPWLNNVKQMAEDLDGLDEYPYPKSTVHLNDSRVVDTFIGDELVDAVITSPPYPNEKDYTRTTRLETVLLGFISSRLELRSFKKALVRSNTRGVYKADTDDHWIRDFPEIIEIANAIEARRIEMGKTSGFERQYHRVTKLYFGGMVRHLSSLKNVLKPGAKLAYVVGDQASYLRVLIRTGEILAKIADRLGYKVERIDLFRKRFSTATRKELREEVVILNWQGK